MRVSCAAVCVGILAGVCLAGKEPAAKDSSVVLLRPGTLAPSFSLPTLEGDRVSLGTWCGDNLNKPHINKVPHTVILSFWATYCKPCQKEIPELTAFVQKNSGKPIKLLCISIDREGASIVKPFVAEKGYAIEVLLDPYRKTSERFGVKSVPALFVVGPDGIIRYASMGYDEKAGVSAKLDRVLAEIASGAKPASGAVEIAGETVSVRDSASQAGAQPAADTAKPAAAPQEKPVVPPKDRWKALARVECGEKPEDLARELKIDVKELRNWYDELKKAALQLWAAPKDPAAQKP